MDTREYGRILVAFVAGVIVGVVLTLVLGRVSDFLNIDASPMDSVSEVSSKEPALLRPQVVMGRLKAATDADWGMEVFTLHPDYQGGKQLKTAGERLRTKIDLPPVQGQVLGVFTNVFDEDSARKNGSLSMIWFSQPVLARDYFLAEPTAFTDKDVQKKVDKYWVGGVAVFYSPGQVDRTDDLRTFFKQMVNCSNRAGLCRIPSDVKGFDKWAERAK